MGFMSIKISIWKKQLASVTAQLDNLYSVMAEMSATGAQSYAFDSGEGSQRTTRRSLSEIQTMIRKLEATQDHLINKLYNMGLVNVRLRRKTPYSGNYNGNFY